MKPGIPWSVKGIDPDIRVAAKDAARRSGMTLGEWLNSVILDQSADAKRVATFQHETAAKDFSADEEPSGGRDDTTIRLEDIAQQLTRLAQRDQQSASIRAYEQPGRQRQDVESLNRILGRLDSNERQTAEAFTAVNERLSILGDQVSRAVERQPGEAPGYQALETALRNIVDHIEVSEKRTRETLKSMQDRMGDMTQRAAESTVVQQSVPAFNDLEARLNELASRVESSETATGATLPDLVRQELGQLAERVEQVREASETFADRAKSSAIEAARTELHDIESRILGLLKEAQNALSDSSADNSAELQRMRAEIGSLDQRIDDVKTDAASEHDVHALRVAFEQLSARVAQGPDLRPLADMDRRLVDVAEKLEKSQVEARKLPQLTELERRFADLDRRLTEAVSAKDDGRAVAALERQLAAVNDRVAHTEQQLGHLETIERAITQLYENVDQSRNTAREIAEDAANRMAERVMAGQAQAPAPGPSPELQALQDGLRAVAETAASAELRNQETLEAVHETLEQIVVKLTELETASAGHQLALSMVQQAAARAPEPQTHYQPPPEPPQANFQRQPEPQYVPPPELEPAPQFEPQIAIPEYEPPPRPQNPFLEQQSSVLQTQMSPVAAMPPHMAVSALDPAMGDDFIDAARRAAQAAQHNVEFVNTASAVEAARKAVGGKPAFKLPFLKKSAATPKLDGPATAKIVPILDAPKGIAGKRRTLVLAGIVLLAAASAIAFNTFGKSPKKPVQPAAIEETAKPKAGLPPMLGASVTAIFVDPLAAVANEIFTGSLPRQKTPSLAAILSGPDAAMASVQEPPEDIGSRSLRQAAARGDAVAQFVIAGRYLDGKPVPQDFAKAAYWYREAAARGLAPAQYRIATLFERGTGVTQDMASALLWYERAATAGNTKAMHNAAVIAAGGKLGKPDYARAFKWFSAAAAHGLKDSQFNLAVLYDRGLGTRADSVEALFWYALAGRQNDTDAKTRAETLMAGLQPAAAAALQRRIDAWTPKPAIREANSVTVTDTDWQYDGGGRTGSLERGLARALAG